jgi:histidinol dehydrogenase
LVGKDSANSLSDYVLGPSHILPTKGSASFSSPLSVEDFIVSSSYIEIKASDNNELYEDILDATFILAEAEGLNAHARAAQIRKKES